MIDIIVMFIPWNKNINRVFVLLMFGLEIIGIDESPHCGIRFMVFLILVL